MALTGTGTTAPAPAVSLSPSSLTFGNQTVGTTSPSQPSTLTNSGNAALNITNIVPSGNFALATTGTSCPYSGGTVNPAASCTIDVTFAPAATGTLTGTITITDNAAGSPQSVALTGTGITAAAPGVSLSPSSLTFGNQTVGTTSPSQPSTLTNTGNAALSITSIVPGGDFALATTSTSCPYSGGIVNAGATCTIDVTFAPSTTGTRTATITITDNAAGSPQSVPLTGNGVGASSPVPQIDQPLGPASTAPGGAGLTLTVNGDGFVPGSAVNWNGSSLTATFVSNRQLTATVPASDIAAAATASITVVNPAPGGGASNVLFLPITDPTASVSLGRLDIAIGNGPRWVRAADFNLDGKLDLAIANNVDGTVSILLGNGDGTFTVQPAVSVGAAPVGAAVGDLNGDGIPDLAVANNTSNSVSILLGNGSGSFTAGTSVRPGNGPAAVALADFNGDGKLDLAVANATDNTVAVLLGNGDGTFGPPAAFSVGTSPQAVVVTDFNGDGLIDLAAANSVDGTVSILLGNGNGTFAVQSVTAVGQAPLALAAADLNSDGIMDLAVANNGGNTISILLGNGDGTFTVGTPVSTGNGPAGITIADLNGDEILDLGVANSIDNTVSIMLGSGNGTFQAGLTFGTGTGPASIERGDFNDDGRIDLATADQSAANASILLQAPAISLTPGSLSFSNQAVGTSSAPQTVTLTNTGSAGLSISGVTTGPDYSQTNTCGNAVSAGASCTFSVTFTPATIGALNESLTITDNAAGSPQSVSLSGTGTAPAVTLSPTSLTFASQQVGTSSSPQAVSLTNSGTATLTVNSIVSSGDFSQTNNCGSTLNAGGTCTITVTFTPTATGTRTGAITITDSASGSPQSVSLSGTGTAPAVTLSPTSLTFASQQVGTSSSPQAISLTNSGTATLTINSIISSGDFSQTNNCGSTLNAGANCTITVTFTPTATGTRTGAITITDNASGSPQSVSLTGTGTGAGASLSPASLTFASQQVGTSSPSQPVTLTNSGNTALTISGISVTGTNKADFSQTHTCGTSLAGGGSCTINVTFKPLATGTRTATLSVTDNAAGSPQTVALTGTGAAPAVSLSPTKLTFAIQLVNTASAMQTVTLTNTGTATLTISSITFTGTDATDFAETNTCGSSVAAGANCTLTVTFTPLGSGTRSGTLNVTDNASGSPQKVSLSGVGTVMSIAPGTLNFGNVKVGTTSPAQTVTITNMGSSSVTITSVTKSGTNAKDFTLTSNTCGSTLGAGANCTVTLTFRPGATGARTANLNVSDSGGGSPQKVTLSGTGT